MPPKVEGQINNYIHRHQPIERKPVKADAPQQPETSGVSSRRSEMNLYGSQQKNRLEKLLVPGLAGVSAFRDVRDIRLAASTVKADNAYRETYLRERNALVNPASAANPPKNMVEVSRRAESAYSAALKKDGFTTLDVRGASVVKAAEFLRFQAKTGGDFTTLSPETIRQRIGANQETKYFARILDQKYLTDSDAGFSRKESPHSWVATPEEIAGAKLDTFETMKRVGYSDEYISLVKDEVSAKRKNLSDFVLSVTEANGTKGKTTPSWDVLTERAKEHNAFVKYRSKPETFWRDVQNLDFKTEIAKSERLGKSYFSGISEYEQDVFNARKELNSALGVNEYFTNDGRTARTDGKNGTYGVREFLIDNTEIQNTQRTTFVELGETGKTGLKTTGKVPEIPENIRSFRNETRNGGLIGGAISAVTSLPQIFEQANNGDYTGAAKTLATNTAVGSGIGTFSAAGERVIGNQIANSLSRSNLANQGLERLYTNGAARNVVSRLAQTEASTITSQTFNTTLRTITGRVGGAGVIGGVVGGAFSSYDQIGAYRRGEVRGAQAFGTIVGETTVGVGAGMAGAAAGAAVGVWFGGVGAVPGAIIGFGVGMAAGYVADKGLRFLRVDKAIAKGVTATIDAGARVAGTVQRRAGQAAQAGRQYVNRQITQARAVYRSASSAVKSARTFVSQRANQTRQAISSGTRAAVNYVSQAGRRAVSAVRNTASRAVNQVSSTVGNVAGQVSSTVSNVANQARSAVSNAVSNVASGAVSNLRSVFGW